MQVPGVVCRYKSLVQGLCVDLGELPPGRELGRSLKLHPGPLLLSATHCLGYLYAAT